MNPLESIGERGISMKRNQNKRIKKPVLQWHTKIVAVVLNFPHPELDSVSYELLPRLLL